MKIGKEHLQYSVLFFSIVFSIWLLPETGHACGSADEPDQLLSDLSIEMINAINEISKVPTKSGMAPKEPELPT